MIFISLQVCLVIDGSSRFYMADGLEDKYMMLQKVSGAFAFIASVLGYYTVLHYLCEDCIGFQSSAGGYLSPL